MTLHDLATKAEKLIADNSPAILSAIGVTGTVTTAFLTGKASFKAAELIRMDDLKRDLVYKHHRHEMKEKIHLVWKLYIPAAGVGVFTVACIIGANRIGSRRAAAMAAAYSISEKAWEQYKDKVIEKLGETKERAVRDEIAQEQVNRNPVSSREVIITGNGDVLCYDTITGRYFQSNVESLRKAQNDINAQILEDMYASLYEFFQLIGLPPTPYSSEVGWNSESLLDLNFSTTLAEDGRPCIAVNYAIFPIRDYHRLN